MFIIHQYTDDIEVFKNNVEYCKVQRKFNIWGQLSTTIIKDGNVLLKSSYNVFFFKKYLKINYQNTTKTLKLLKNGGQYILQVDNIYLTLKRHYYKNPIYTIHDDLDVVTEISSKLNGIAETPTVYDFNVKDQNSDYEIYYLIRFLIEVPPTMDV